MFALFDSGSPVLVAVAFFVGNPLIQASMFGPVGAYLSEMFEPTARYSGVSATYQLGSLLGAGLAPLFAQELVTADAGTRDLGLYIVAAYVVSGLAVWFSRNAGERRGDPAAAEPARTPVDA